MKRMSSAERRSELIRAAVRVVGRDGVAAATTRAIVAEAGMSLASFHYAFQSRDEMMRDLIAYVVEEESNAAMQSLVVSGDIRSTIRDGLQAYLDLLVQEPAHELAMFELLHYTLRTPGMQDLAQQQYVNYHSSVTRVVEAGARTAGIEWTVPSVDIARMIVTVTDGVTFAWLADRDTDAAGRVLDFAADALAALAVPLHHTSSSSAPPVLPANAFKETHR